MCVQAPASAGRINRVEGGKGDRVRLKLTEDMRHHGAGLDGVLRARAVLDLTPQDRRSALEPATRLRNRQYRPP